VPGQLKANLPATMAFRVRDAVNSRILLGDGNPQAASLPAIAGRGIWQTGDVQAEVQTPWLDRQEAAAMLENWSQAATTSGPAGGTEPVTRCPISAADPARASMSGRMGAASADRRGEVVTR
jgi:DNA segregation ATPase FtsK/SpoIIIE-like protein